MGNILLTDQVITQHTLMILRNNLKIAPYLFDGYSDEFGQAGHKIGDTLQVRRPQRFIGNDGQLWVAEPLSNTSTPVVVQYQKHVDFAFSSSELKLSIDKFAEIYLNPAAVALANIVDRICADVMYKNTANLVGTPGTVPNALLTYLQAGQKLDEMGAPTDDERYMVIKAGSRVAIVDALKGLFQDSTQIGKQYRTGMIGIAAGYMWVQDENIVTHTVGPLGGTPLIDTTQSAEGGNNATMTLKTKGWTAAAAARLKQGDNFTIANVNAVNPQHRQSTGSLQQFTVQQDFSSDASGNGSVLIYPAITPTSPTAQYANVDAAAIDGAAITVAGAANTATPQLLCFHQNAFAFVSVPLDVPDGTDMAYQERDPKTKCHLRFVRQYWVGDDQWKARMDILFGVSPLNRELCCRVAS